MKKINKDIFLGLIFTLLMSFIVDSFAPYQNPLLRILLVICLVIVGYVIYTKIKR